MKIRTIYTLIIYLFTYIGLLCQFASKIYYTRYDTYNPFIYSSDLDGSNETHFSLPNKPKSIAVDWNNTPVKLFIALDLGSGNGKIIRCNTDGSNQEDVVPTTTGQVNDIELNVGAKEIYWIEDHYSDDYIYRGVMYGTNYSPIEIYHSTTDNVTLWGLGYNVGDNTLWFTLRGSNNSNSYVKQILTNGTALHTVKNPVNNPHDIEFYNGNYYLCTGEGIAKIEGDTKVYSVIQASETSGDGISIDSYNNKIYWVDYIGYVVKKCNLDGSSVETVSSGSHSLLQKIDTDYNESALPVELTSFTAQLINNKVKLNWRTVAEVDNYGFEIERASSRQDWKKIGFVKGYGNSNSPKEYSFTDDLNDIGAAGTIKYRTSTKLGYRLKQIDIDGSFEYSNVIEVEIDTPDKFVLRQNYPNPFSKGSGGNSTTRINYSIPMAKVSSRAGISSGVGVSSEAAVSNEAAVSSEVRVSSEAEVSSEVAVSSEVERQVTLKVYDILGREVAVLVNKMQTPGNYEVIFDGSNLSCGIYFIRLQVIGENSNLLFTQTRKAALLK